MPLDLRILNFREVLKVSSLANVEGLEPRTLDVRGPNFAEAELVRIDGMFSPDVVVLSPTQLLAQVPTSLENEPISEVQVFTSRVSTNKNTLIDFIVGPAFNTTEGEEKLLQAFLLELMTTPGSDVHDQDRGGGALRLMGGTISPSSRSGMVNALKIAVSKARDSLTERQLQQKGLPTSETLASAEVRSVNVDPESTTIFVSLQVLSVAGGTVLAALEV